MRIIQNGANTLSLFNKYGFMYTYLLLFVSRFTFSINLCAKHWRRSMGHRDTHPFGIRGRVEHEHIEQKRTDALG